MTQSKVRLIFRPRLYYSLSSVSLPQCRFISMESEKYFTRYMAWLPGIKKIQYTKDLSNSKTQNKYIY